MRNKYLIIALITTTGKRDLNNSLNSIKEQTRKVDNIFIASEINLNINENLLVIFFSKDLAKNTNQALLRIKKMYKNKKVFIATLDDDDFWKKDYIRKVEELIKQNYNFISGFLEYKEKAKTLDILKFDSKLTYQDFLYENPGIEGSNKVFDLDIALESGMMLKHINTATDRAFNINLLLHPEIKLGVIDEVVAIHNVDSSNRITNNPKKLIELRKFYKHYREFIDKEKIESINKRHKELHNIKEEVISWK